MPCRTLDPLDFYPTLEAGEGPVLVAFVKPGCGACRMMKAALERIAVASFVVDIEQGPGLAAAYEIFHLPALFLWQDGDYHAQLEAAPTPAAIVEAVAAALRQPAQEEP